MKYETREKKDKAKHESELENMFKDFGMGNNAKGRDRFKDLKLTKKNFKRKNK